MKRLVSVLLVLALVLCLCGCDKVAVLLDRFRADTPEAEDVVIQQPEEPEEKEEGHKKNPNYTPIVGEDPIPEDNSNDAVEEPPQQQPAPDPKPEPVPDPEPEPEPTPKPEPEPEPNPKPEPEPEPTPDPEPEPEKPTKPDKIEVTAAQLQQIEDEFLVLVNQERARVGLNPIAPNAVLTGYAKIRAEEIKTLFSHDRPDGSEWISILNRDEYPYTAAGENIVMTSHVGNQAYNPNKDYWIGSPEQISAAAAWTYKLFRESPKHYANMTHTAYTESGIGITYVLDQTGSVPIFYLTHLFGAQ